MIKKENIAFLDILKFMAAICISCTLHYHDHFVPAYGINYPFVHNDFFYYWSTHGWLYTLPVIIGVGIKFTGVNTFF